MNRYRPFVLVLLFFFFLSLLLTWPLPLHMGTQTPGDGSDDPAILWNLWWVRFATTELRQNPFHSAWLFWPIGINLAFYTLTTLNGLISIPVQLAFGLLPANSFVVYFELVMAAAGTWLLARWLLAQHPDAAPFARHTRDGIAVLSAVVYAFGASKWLYLSLGQFNIAASHWLPWAVLYLARMWAARSSKRGLREAALCTLFVLFTGWTEFTYASFFIQFAFFFWLWHLLGPLWRRDYAHVWRFTGLAVVLGALFLLGMAPILSMMAEELRTSGDFLVEGLGFANVFSNDLLGFVVPGNQHPLFGDAVEQFFSFEYFNFAFLGWVTMGVAAAGLFGRRTRRYALSWTFLSAVFVLLSLGPTLRVNGREWELSLPFDLLLQLPFLKANRYPSRYAVLIALCMAMLVAWGACALLARLGTKGTEGTEGTHDITSSPHHLASSPQAFRRRTVLVVLGALLLLEHAGAPLPLSDYRVPAVYEEVKEREGEALLEIPLAWRNGFRVTGPLHEAFMFAQAMQPVHEKRLLG
ncbi:MAG: hypothetical protein ACRDIB_07785, partial [Ardenticatenaceae bacterium]